MAIDETERGARFGSYVLDEYGAPKLSELTKCGAPELPELPNHLAVAVLNLVVGVRGDYAKDDRRRRLNFIRRTETAVGEYRLGRAKLQAYVEQLSSRNNHFLEALRALSHFEQCAAASYQAAELAAGLLSRRLFEKVDGSRWNRLYNIYNRSKHFGAERRSSLKARQAGNRAPFPAVPVWLINEGLESTDASITFAELHDIIVNLREGVELIASGGVGGQPFNS
jgi:hypothetical protein